MTLSGGAHADRGPGGLEGVAGGAAGGSAGALCSPARDTEGELAAAEPASRCSRGEAAPGTPVSSSSCIGEETLRLLPCPSLALSGEGYSDLTSSPSHLPPQELGSLRQQVEQLAEENLELELQLQRSLAPPPGSPGEGEGSPGLGEAELSSSLSPGLWEE